MKKIILLAVMLGFTGAALAADKNEIKTCTGCYKVHGGWICEDCS
jgi:hypothetical protein